MRRCRVVVSALTVAALTVVSGCVSAIAPRPGEVAEPGKLGGSINLSIGAYAPGSVSLDEPTGRRVRSGNSGARYPLSPASILGGFLVGLELEGRIGVGGGCEAVVTLGYFRTGVETRCALASEDDGAGASVAVGGGGGIRLADLEDGSVVFKGHPWGRFGVDVSRRVGDSFLPMANAYVSYGTERHGISDPNPEVAGHSDPSITVDRRELRINLAIAAGWRVHDHGYIYLGAVPYVTPWASAPSCPGCVAFEEDWGFQILLGGGALQRD